MEIMKSRVYILLDDKNRITRLEGEYSLPSDLTGWILVEEGAPCDRLNLAQSHYLPKSLITDEGVYRYKYLGDEILERSDDEIAEDISEIPAPPPTIEEQFADLVQYVDILSDFMLDGDI